MKASILATASAVPFALAGPLHPRDAPWQVIPTTAKPPNTFNNGTVMELGQPDEEPNAVLPDIFQPRPIDIPFGRLLYGKIKYYRQGEMNSVSDVKDVGVGTNDDAKQSACGIPDNAYQNSKVSIHPYWLKYAGLDRYCMQDVCVAFWTGTGDDMISKVTDICSTDPNDPSHCETPNDIKLPRTKVQVLRHKGGDWRKLPEFSGNEDTKPIYWYFSKCLGESVVQPPYKAPGTDNWFSKPYYPKRNQHAVQVTFAQYKNNQKSYPSKGWDTYQNGITPGRTPDKFDPKVSKITDWVRGKEPAWQPVAGGEGFGKTYGDGKTVRPINKGYGNDGKPVPAVAAVSVE